MDKKYCIILEIGSYIEGNKAIIVLDYLDFVEMYLLRVAWNMSGREEVGWSIVF